MPVTRNLAMSETEALAKAVKRANATGRTMYVKALHMENGGSFEVSAKPGTFGCIRVQPAGRPVQHGTAKGMLKAFMGSRA